MGLSPEGQEMLPNPTVPTPRGNLSQRENGSDNNQSTKHQPNSSKRRKTDILNSTTIYPSETISRRRVADPEVIRKVEELVDQIISSLHQHEGNISIALKTKKSSNVSPTSRSPVRSMNTQYKLSFPGNTPQEAWRFSRAELKEKVCSRTMSMLICSPAVVLRILELIHEALVNDIIVSKRNIYYQDVELFKSQKVVDRYVEILSYTFVSVPAVGSKFFSHAYIQTKTAAAKGLVAGSFITTYHDGSTSSSTGDQDARYPDISTRTFLRFLSISAYPPPPIYAMVDFDPDGISIMSTYKHGSLTMSHEDADLRTPTVRWLGIKSKDLMFKAPSNDGSGLLRLSIRDRKKAISMLGQENCEEDGVEQEWRKELQLMLMLNMKVEMEVLSEREGGINEWVEDRLLEEALTSR
ncbi:MAG: hypothetical protein Q9222_003731 [Ikaeria aurantiellina]